MAEAATILTTVFDLATQAFTAFMYALVAHAVLSREVSERARLANTAFATWWWVLMGISVIAIVWNLVSLVVTPNLPAFLTYFHVLVLVIMLAMSALLYYFAYLYTGRQNAWVWTTLYYLLAYGFFVYYISLAGPVAVNAAGELTYTNDLEGTILANILGAVFFLPLIIGAAMYLSLTRKASSTLMRFRIGVVAGSIFLWFSISLGSSFSGVSSTYTWWTYVSRAISISVAALVLIAYRPPAWVRQRFRLDDASSATTVQTQSLQPLPGTAASERDEEE